jgi:hypothetical protein
MTISADIPRDDYTGTGSANVYSYTFYIADESELAVYTRVISTGVQSLLTLNVDYTVSGVGNSGGGTITLAAGNLPATKTISIIGNLPNAQEYNIGSGSRQTSEDAADDTVRMIQQLQEKLDRSIHLQESLNPGTVSTTIDDLLDEDRALVIGPTGVSVGPTVSDLEDAVSGTTGAAASAAAAALSATAAASSATSASGSATSASTSATAAAASATAAATSETNASNSAGDAATSATQAETYKDLAETAAASAAADLASFSNFRSELGVPSDALGNDGDHYLDQNSRYLYKKAGGTYSVVAVLAGGGGVGSGGITIVAAIPGAGVGSDGDVALNTTNGEFYEKIAGVWTLVYTDQGTAAAADVSYDDTATSLGVANVQDAIFEVKGLADAAQGDATQALADAAAAQADATQALTAAGTSYDGTSAGLAATDVQAAIDETVAYCDTLSSDLNIRIVGAGPVTDNQIPKYNGTTGVLVQASGVTIDDSDIITAVGLLLSGLTASRAIVTDGSKNLESSAVTATEMGYLSGVTSGIQAQIAAKAAKRSVATFSATAVTPGTSENQTHVYNGAATGSAFTGFGTIASMTNGTRLTLMGSSDTNYLALAESNAADGWLMNGPLDLTYGRTITFEYNSTLARMVEVART